MAPTMAAVAMPAAISDPHRHTSRRSTATTPTTAAAVKPAAAVMAARMPAGVAMAVPGGEGASADRR